MGLQKTIHSPGKFVTDSHKYANLKLMDVVLN
jgi:hypothetical protein